jgi:hypothetical protein
VETASSIEESLSPDKRGTDDSDATDAYDSKIMQAGSNALMRFIIDPHPTSTSDVEHERSTSSGSR